jgi:deoxyribodipyrimidine photo-lyase
MILFFKTLKLTVLGGFPKLSKNNRVPFLFPQQNRKAQMEKINIFWFRRDLRLHDNAGLYQALREGRPVLPLFIFDTQILDKLEDKKDARVEFIHEAIHALSAELSVLGSGILVRYGDPLDIWKALSEEFHIHAVFTNNDYEPYARRRDEAVESFLQSKDIPFVSFKDHLIFEKDEVVKEDSSPYVVFTPYSRKWREKLQSRMVSTADGKGGEESVSFYLKSYPTNQYFGNFYKTKPFQVPALESMGFQRTGMEIPSATVGQGLIRNYDKTRDFPALRGTSRLGVHFRFGTISIREKARKALRLNAVFLNELIWRDFYAMILWHFPHVADRAFYSKYDYIEWRNDEGEFEKWCLGKTGYPIVDAGMRELNATGFMHNRVRMIAASFLTKHLLIDWHWGEAYFASKLLDFDLASNNGGWQWAAGTGTDAAPYFRIFNPAAQQKKFDPDLQYVRKWAPELDTAAYPQPVVDHKEARERCLRVYKAALEVSR